MDVLHTICGIAQASLLCAGQTPSVQSLGVNELTEYDSFGQIQTHAVGLTQLDKRNFSLTITVKSSEAGGQIDTAQVTFSITKTHYDFAK